MKTCTRLTALLLSVVLLVALAVVPASAEVAHVHDHDHITEVANVVSVKTGGISNVQYSTSSSGPNHVHVWTGGRTETVTNFCTYTSCEIYVEYCSCGARRAGAMRPTGSPTGQSHNLTSVESGSGCPDHPNTDHVCSSCGFTLSIDVGGHQYTDHNESKDATCTEAGYNRSYCSCGAYTGKEIPALGHKLVETTEWNCDKGTKCERCGAEFPGTNHNLVYVNNGSTHDYQCSRCGYKEIQGESHSDPDGNGKCVCGAAVEAPKPAGCPHTHQTLQKAGAFNHRYVCDDCKQVVKTERCSDYESTRTYCTDATYCTVCGNKVNDGAKSHNFWKGWEQTATNHTRKCQNPGCKYEESGDHTFSSTTDCTKAGSCSVCGYRSGSSANKEHNWSTWTNNGNGSHTRYCKNAGCTAQQSAVHTAKSGDCDSATVCAECGAVISAATGHVWGHWENGGSGGHYRSCLHCDAKQSTNHSGGTATCGSAAVCSACGATYGSKNPNNHSGGTEVLNHKEAAVGQAGYTGDTYCLGCGALLQKGKETTALAASHTHSYGTTIHKDSTYHWKECTCGSVSEKEKHTFKDGVCTKCGESDPNYVAPKKDHVHNTGTEMKSNETNHWKVCKDCNAIVDSATHTYKDGYQSDATNHWRVCSVCGYKHSEPHDFQSGSCAVCGAKEAEPDASPAPAESGKPAESTKPSESSKPSESATPGETAKPGESAAPSASAKPGASTEPGDSQTPAPEGSAAPAPEGSTAPAPSGSTAPAPSGSAEPEPTAAPAPVPGPKAPANVEQFKDLDEEEAYYEPVKQVIEMGLMNGVSEDSFDPDGEFTRAQLAAVMYNLAGQPEVNEVATFSDMDGAKWATTAVSWAKSTGVVSGVGENKFNPGGVLDRQTLAVILHNYAESNGYDTEVDEAAVDEVKDLDQAAGWAKDAMAWAVSKGLYTPDEDGNVSPTDPTQRSMVAVVTVIFIRNEDITVGGAE